MSDPVLDASAVLALILKEPGAAEVGILPPNALLCAVNHAEVVSKLCERGLPDEKAVEVVHDLRMDVIPFDEDLATATAWLRSRTGRFGLSLGDRACLALGARRGAVVVTAERRWDAEVEAAAGVTIRRVRGGPAT